MVKYIPNKHIKGILLYIKKDIVNTRKNALNQKFLWLRFDSGLSKIDRKYIKFSLEKSYNNIRVKWLEINLLKISL